MATIRTSLARGALTLAFLAFVAAPSGAAPINYGDFAGDTIMFLDVTETANTPDDTEPLYGAPEIIGNKLDFDPAGFTASANEGSSDLTDGQLNFTLMATEGNAITSISFMEGGDYSLLGTGTAATQTTFAIGIGSIVVTEVDGVALGAPVVLAGASVGGGDDLSLGTENLSPWTLGLVYDVNAALTQAGIDFGSGATKLELAINDGIAAISEPSSIAYIAKKDFMIDVSTVPEPGTAALLGLALGALAIRRARAC